MNEYSHICSPAPRERAILPFPERRPLQIRELAEADLELQRAFFAGLSAETRRWRFMGPKQDLSESLLKYLSAADGSNHVAFMVEANVDGQPVMVAEARYVADEADPQTCEFALCVSDDWQGRGIATRLLETLERHARANGRRRMVAEALYGNTAMIALARKAGYTVALNCRDPRAVRLTKTIAAPHDVAA